MGNTIHNIGVMCCMLFLFVSKIQATDTITVFTPECDWSVDYCLPIENVSKNRLQILLDGKLYEGTLKGCNAVRSTNGFKTTSYSIPLFEGLHQILLVKTLEKDSIRLIVAVKCEQEKINCNKQEELIAAQTDDWLSLNIAAHECWQYQFSVDGSVFRGEITKEKEVPMLQFDLNIVSGHAFEIKDWIINSKSFSGTFENIELLKAALNEHCGENIWRTHRGTRLIGGSIAAQNEKMPITLLDRHLTKIKLPYTIYMEATELLIRIPPTANELKIENITNRCYERIPLNVNYALKSKN